MPEKKNRLWLIAIPVVLLIVAGIAVVLVLFRPGIQVTVENTGTTPLRSVVLHVTGASCDLGDIAPGATATARVRSTGESSLDIEFTDGHGNNQRLNAGGYFESGYRGTIRVEIKDGQIDKFEEDIKLW